MPHLHCSPHKEHQLNRKALQVSDSLSINLWPAQKAVRTDRFRFLGYFPFLHPGVFPHVPKQPQSASNLNYTTIIPKTHRNFNQGINMKQNFCLHSCPKIIHLHTDTQDHDGNKLWETTVLNSFWLEWPLIQIFHICLCHMATEGWNRPHQSAQGSALSLKQGQVTKLKQHENSLQKVFIALDKIPYFRIWLHEFWQTADTWMKIQAANVTYQGLNPL